MAAAPRRQLADAPDREPARPFPTLGDIAPVHANAPSADRIVCRGRAGEQVAPPRGAVSDGRQPTERDIRAAAGGGPATSQGGVWIRIASSRSRRQSWPAHCLCASLAWRAWCLLADAPMLPGWEVAGRGHWAQLWWDPRPLPHRAGGARPKPSAGASEGWCAWALGPYRRRRCCTAASAGTRTRPHGCEVAHHLRGVHAGDGRASRGAAAAGWRRPPRALRP
jgi:hypothetical protein